MLLPEPIALLTPYAKLSNPLPTKEVVERIKALASRAYCTAWPTSQKPPRRQGIDGIVGAATKSRRALLPSGGNFRLRLRLNDPASVLTVELIGLAKQM
jgi:hypothetical protein